MHGRGGGEVWRVAGQSLSVLAYRSSLMLPFDVVTHRLARFEPQSGVADGHPTPDLLQQKILHFCADSIIQSSSAFAPV